MLLLVLLCGVFTPSASQQTRNPTLWPFAINSIWNTPIGSNVQFVSASSTIAQSFQTGTSWIGGSLPLWQASNSDPIFNVTWANHNYYYPIPSDATPSTGMFTPPLYSPFTPQSILENCTGSDHDLIVFQPDQAWEYESWLSVLSGTNKYSVSYLVKVDLYGGGVGGGIRAAGFPLIGGLIRASEAQNNYIPHALAYVIGQNQAVSPWVWPAISEDGNHAGYSVRISFSCSIVNDCQIGTRASWNPSGYSRNCRSQVPQSFRSWSRSGNSPSKLWFLPCVVESLC